MKHFIAACCAVTLVSATLATEADAPPSADREQLRAQAGGLRDRARLMRAQADKTKADAEMLCRDKLLFAGCMADARKARQEAERAILRIERDAGELERQYRYQAQAEKLERRAEQDLEQAAKAAERAEAIRQEDEQRRLKNEKRLAKEEKQRQKALGN